MEEILEVYCIVAHYMLKTETSVVCVFRFGSRKISWQVYFFYFSACESLLEEAYKFPEHSQSDIVLALCKSSSDLQDIFAVFAPGLKVKEVFSSLIF